MSVGADPQQVADAVVHAMLLSDKASAQHGITLVSAAPGEVTVAMTVTGDHVNGHNVCHGGVLFLLADTAFGLCCNSHGPQAVASGGDIVYARPAYIGDRLRAQCVERGRFGRSGVYDTTVTRGADVIAEFRGRSRVIADGQPGSDGVRIAGAP